MNKINFLGLLSANNPRGRKLSHQENNARNMRLLQDINQLGLPYDITKNNNEDSFIVYNIIKDKLIELGVKYDQDAVIWGISKLDYHDNYYFEFQFIENGLVRSRKTIYVEDEHIEDLIKSIKEGKFTIPFFKDEYDEKNQYYQAKRDALEKQKIKVSDKDKEINRLPNPINSEINPDYPTWDDQ